ncbi:hypothetical protein KGQ27_02680 [Patescibacteria group bacterium]|nr:hypothetical protein [Patescibacteria group bacterium]MDE1946773.1 hypothetical protein [Patescibacteria group bacterium]MDE2011095.1 hypothetical protein [Patescibacteria group bacterium]MDE2233599.1 hypothetical protein [Patescibacteria group bacterium]
MKTTPKDFFLHLGATVALFVSAGALLNLYFSVINYFMPDRLTGYFYASSVVWPISMLIVLVPVLYVLEWNIARDISKTPDKREVWIRKWRIYLTLFLAGALIIGDLIALINTYLNGEISARFISKIIAVLLIAAIIFAYYILVRSAGAKKTAQKILAWLGILIVIAGIVGGFMAVGSPEKQRNLRFDDQRISDLENIQWRTIAYWQQKGKLPDTLASLNDAISGFTVPTDPADHSSYQYIAKSGTQFELCATFALPSQDTSVISVPGAGPVAVPMAYSAVSGNDNWAHEAGKACFDRMIDPQAYPSFKNQSSITK